MDIFDEYNDLYFEGQLTPIDGVFYSTRLPSVGLTSLVGDDEPKIRVFIHQALSRDSVRLRGALIHELIHVWQIQQYLSTGNEIFLDLESGGHGDVFQSVVEEIKFHHPSIMLDLSDDSPVPKVMDRPNYQYLDISFKLSSSTKRAIYNLPGKKVPDFSDLQLGLERIYGKESICSISLRESKDPYVTCFASLTHHNKFYVRQPPVYFDESDLRLISDDISSELEGLTYPSKIEKSKELDGLSEKHRNKLHFSFQDYFNSVVDAAWPELSVIERSIQHFAIYRDEDFSEIHGAWLMGKSALLERSDRYYSFMNEMKGVIDPDKVGIQYLAAIKDFGWKRINKREALANLSDALVDSVSITSAEEILRFIEPRICNPAFYKSTMRGADKHIMCDMDTYVFHGFIEKISDGYQIRPQIMLELKAEWENPEFRAIQNSDFVRGKVEIMMDKIFPLFAQGSYTAMQRSVDLEVSTWGSTLSRGISIEVLGKAIHANMRTAISNSRGVGRMSQERLALVKGFGDQIPDLLASAAVHCFGTKSPDFRKPRTPTDQQILMGF